MRYYIITFALNLLVCIILLGVNIKRIYNTIKKE